MSYVGNRMVTDSQTNKQTTGILVRMHADYYGYIMHLKCLLILSFFALHMHAGQLTTT